MASHISLVDVNQTNHCPSLHLFPELQKQFQHEAADQGLRRAQILKPDGQCIIHFVLCCECYHLYDKAKIQSKQVNKPVVQ
jgi:hypothetical protein